MRNWVEENTPPLCAGKEVLFRPVMYEAVALFAKDMPSIRLSDNKLMWMSREPAMRSLLPCGKKASRLHDLHLPRPTSTSFLSDWRGYLELRLEDGRC